MADRDGSSFGGSASQDQGCRGWASGGHISGHSNEEDGGAGSEVRGFKYQDGGAGSEVRGTRYQDGGAGSEVRGTRYPDGGPGSEVRGTSYPDGGVGSQDRRGGSQDGGAGYTFGSTGYQNEGSNRSSTLWDERDFLESISPRRRNDPDVVAMARRFRNETMRTERLQEDIRQRLRSIAEKQGLGSGGQYD